ncbi:Arf guanine nucleotide exchange factor sbh1 [Orobanche gracilis]
MELIYGGFRISDELLGTFAPIVVYWVYSGIYVMLGSMENFRLHSKKDEDEKNLVSKKDVVIGVLLQQVVQAIVATVLFAVLQFQVLFGVGEDLS